VVAGADRSFIVVDHAAVDAATVGAGRGDMMAEKGSISPAAFYQGEAELRRLLRDVEDRYGAAFADELDPGAFQDFKHMIDCVDAFFDLPASKTSFKVKLMDCGKIRSDVLEFCRFYARWLGSPLMERLRHEIY